jgi:hypothetical protein
MRPSTLLLPAAFAANRCPPLPPSLPPLPLLLSRNRLHGYHRGQTHCCVLPKKEATAAAPPAYHLQYKHENVYKPRQLGLIYNLSTVFDM